MYLLSSIGVPEIQENVPIVTKYIPKARNICSKSSLKLIYILLIISMLRKSLLIYENNKFYKKEEENLFKIKVNVLTTNL